MDHWRPQKAPRENYDTRFQYPQPTRLSQPKNAVPTHASQFPPHPSVRVPPNVKAGGKQVPPGAGFASRPMNPTNIPRPQHGQAAPMRPTNSGRLEQDFRFPQAPSPNPQFVHSNRQREQAQYQLPRSDMNDSNISLVEDGTTAHRVPPFSKSPKWTAPPMDRYSASVYADTETPNTPQLGTSFRTGASPQISYKGSRTQLKDTVGGQPARPAVAVTRNDPNKTGPVDNEMSSASSRTATMNALSAAVAAGLSTKPITSRSPTPSTPLGRTTPMRMPFGDVPSPTSPTDGYEDLEPPQLVDPTLNGSTMHTPNSAKSAHSTIPLLGLGIDQPSMSNKIPASRRPPRLDMDVIKEAETRASTTSLSELIRRATKVAANLDRGKTASRFGMLGMYGNTDKPGARVRDSTMSDMISAFPAPAAGNTPRRDTMWPLGEKTGKNMSSNEDAETNKARRCCGMSIPVFIVILIVAILLVTAAVLVPIYLVVLPKQHRNQSDLSKCGTTYPCRNGGTSIVSNNACNCVCSNGFIGNHCDVPGAASDCTTVAIADGSTQYNNATMGSSVVPLFSEAQTNFGIHLNASVLLSLFASTNLSCISENQLVDFGSTSISKRFVMLPDFSNKSPQPVPIPTRSYNASPQKRSGPLQANRIVARGDPVGTSNGIVFQATSTTASATASIGTAVSTVTSMVGGTATSSAAASSATSTPQATEQQLDFAKVVVLYVLQRSTTISIAVNAQQRLAEYFVSNNNTQKVDVGFGSLQLTADFGKFAIENGDGSSVSGKNG